jgi:DEAD/DEAH box helicase
VSDEQARRVFRQLQALARADYGGNTGALLVVYGVEGFLRRLAASEYASNMTLKGGMLMAAISARRMTKDADLSTRGVGSEEERARRVLSSAYADVLAARDGLTRLDAGALPTVRDQLRRLASSLEAHAVLSADLSRHSRETASFVSAEALSLLLDLPEPEPEPEPEPDTEGDQQPEAEIKAPRYRLGTTRGFHAIECGLLYLAAGFDSNAAVAARAAGQVPATAAPGAEAFWAERAYRAFIALLQMFADSPVVRDSAPAHVPPNDDRVDEQVRAELLRRLELATTDHLRWLSFQDPVDVVPTAERLVNLSSLLRSEISPRYVDLAHLSVLLLWAIESTQSRALRSVPSPGTEAFDTYVRARSVERPLVWPSTATYAASCLPGPTTSAVVALPTGSGKSFTAEIAIAQALTDGWVLYLVPTNALAGQVRRDLTHALAPVPNVRIRAFFGDGQYTELGQETVADVGPGSVLVMTPEKCALALRRSPDAFATLRLCVFDECHQMGESGGRGAIAELVVSHLISLAPECRFLLMSALVSNASEVADWLADATGRAAVPISSPWRPTRTLRAIVGFDRRSSAAASDEAKHELAAAGDRRKNWSFRATYSMLANLQGAWSGIAAENYVTLTLPVAGELEWHRDRDGLGWHYSHQAPTGYVNRVVGDLSNFFAAAGEQVLAFLPASRHHPFAVSQRIELRQAGKTYDGGQIRLDSLLVIADWELGVRSQLRDALRRGAAVHTSSVVDAERQVAEAAFRGDFVSVMLATGTLAQGLNLPATMVIVGGTDVGDRRASRTPEGRIRSLAQLVNAIGRAGRPTVAARSAALVVPSTPMWLGDGTSTIEASLEQAEVLGREDAAVDLKSPLDSLVTAALESTMTQDGMSQDELTAFTYLPIAEDIAPTASTILSRSFGVWRHNQDGTEDTATQVADTLQALGNAYLEQADVPDWIASVAYRSGLALPQVVELYRAMAERLDQPRDTLDEWLDMFGALVRVMPATIGRVAVKADELPAGAAFSTLKKPVIAQEDWAAGWDALYAVVRRYFAGDDLAALARYAFAIEGEVSPARSDGTKPIPKIIGVRDRATYGLSMLAGGLAALFAAAEEAEVGDEWALTALSRLSLEMLPLAIRNGCGTRSSLSWFRFGIRHRRVAHLLASRMPVPAELTTDEEIEAFVANARNVWTEGAVDLPGTDAEQAVLTAARVVIANRLVGDDT